MGRPVHYRHTTGALAISAILGLLTFLLAILAILAVAERVPRRLVNGETLIRGRPVRVGPVQSRKLIMRYLRPGGRTMTRPSDRRNGTMNYAPEQIKAAVRSRFVRLALAPQEEKRFPVGAASARRLGYGPAEIDSLPAEATESFAGVGNPLALGEPRPGEVVLDLGCGAGLDSMLAARRVGPAGRVVGVDFAPEMVEKARRNAAAAGAANAEFLTGDAEALPLSDASVDVVISNGVLNLCPDKPGVLAEVFRVLRPGGRLRMADILLHDEVTPEEVARLGEWSD